MQFPRRRRPRSFGRAHARRNYSTLAIAFLVGALFPVVAHGLSLFLAAFLPFIVFATAPFIG